jgi:predicted dinucleotide-binding enzyme
MKKTVAVIGADGNIGAALAFRLAKAGYRTLVTSHTLQDLTPFIGKLPLLLGKIRLRVPHADGAIVFSAREASWEADIIILAVPSETQAEIAGEIKDVVTGKVVISLENPLNGTHSGPVTPPTNSVAAELAQLLPHSRIVRALSTTVADQPGEVKCAGLSVDVLVGGDDDEAVSTVMQLAKDVGYHPLVAGKLAMNRTVGK